MNNGNKEKQMKEFNIKSLPMNLSFNKLKDFITKRFKLKYSKDLNNQLNLNKIEDFIFNKKTHLVALFKDHMIADYIDEFLKREYSLKESQERLPKFATYYLNYLTFFGLPTFSDYIANEIIKEYGEKRAEVYYNKNYNHGKGEESFSNIEDEDEFNISKSRIMRTIFNSRIKDTIDNVTIFTIKHTESNIVSNSNTFIQKKKKKQIASWFDSQEEETITLKGNGTIGSNNETDLISNETSLVSYIRMFNRHQLNTSNKPNNRIKVKRLGNYAPANNLTKLKKENTNNKSDVGSGTIDNSNNIPHNQCLTKFKGLISATNLFLQNKKQQSFKSPFCNLNSNKSNGSNCSTLKMNNNNNASKDNLSLKKNKSRNAPQIDLGFKSENILQINDQRFQLTKTQKIDNIISKYTIYNHSKLLSSNSKSKQTLPCSQLKMTLKNHPLVVRQLNQNGYVKSNPNFWKRKNSSQSSNHNNKEQYGNNPKKQKKQNTDDLMKIALSLLMESKKAKSDANVNININNQININTNFPIKAPIDNKVSKNDHVAMNINSNLNNILKSNKYSRNKTNSNGLGSNTEEDGTIPSSGKGKIFSTWGLDHKKQWQIKKKNQQQIKFTSNNFNRPPSNDYSLKQSKRQQPQIKSYIFKDNITKHRPKVSFSSSNCFLQTLGKPFVASANTKSTGSFKNQK